MLYTHNKGVIYVQHHILYVVRKYVIDAQHIHVYVLSISSLSSLERSWKRERLVGGDEIRVLQGSGAYNEVEGSYVWDPDHSVRWSAHKISSML
jgi:hypothetical protein